MLLAGLLAAVNEVLGFESLLCLGRGSIEHKPLLVLRLRDAVLLNTARLKEIGHSIDSFIGGCKEITDLILSIVLSVLLRSRVRTTIKQISSSII